MEQTRLDERKMMGRECGEKEGRFRAPEVKGEARQGKKGKEGTDLMIAERWK